LLFHRTIGAYRNAVLFESLISVKMARISRQEGDSFAVGWAQHDATLAGGRPLGPGPYTLRIAAAGVRDVAGNPLDGAFRGSFPSGSGRAGGDFVARFLVAGGRAGRPIPVR